MVITREVSYDVDGLRMIGHLARPEGTGPWAAVLFGHDGIGLDEYQRRHADRLAEHGYVALAMDYHGGRVFTDPREMLDRVVPLVTDPERMRAIGRAALDTLLAEPRADPERLAAIGYGGGTIALELGRSIYGGAEHAFLLPPTNPDGTPDLNRTHHTGTVLPGVSYHPRHAPRAWRDVLDLLAETLGTPGRHPDSP